MADQSIVPYEEPRSETPDVWRPVLTVAQVVQRQNAIAAVMHDAMRKDTHYGVIPGTKGKPSLLKAGAEMLTTFFGLSKSFTIMERVEDWTGEQHGGTPFFYYLIRCHLRRGDALIAEADGSCNSLESKYKYRTEWKNNQKTRVLNDDVPSVVNTILKMAQKRALVAATLLAVGASDFFTQDVEDMAADYIEAEIVTTPTQPEPPSPPPSPASQNGKGKVLEPDALLKALRDKATRHAEETGDAPISPMQVKTLAAAMSKLEPDDQRRHTFLAAAFGVSSTHDLKACQALALADWMAMQGWEATRAQAAEELARVVNREIQAQATGSLFDTESAGK